MIMCDKDYRTCGHCKARFPGKFTSSKQMLPWYDKTDFHSAHLVTEWMCPNAPKPEVFGVDVTSTSGETVTRFIKPGKQEAHHASRAR